MITAFKKYLSTLKLGPVSRKLYVSDVARFFSYLGTDPTLEMLSAPKSYRDYLKFLESRATAPSMIKRTIVSLRWLANYLALTYSLANPMSELSASLKSMSNSSVDAFSDYIKHFTKYLNNEHLSPLTIKSYKSDTLRYLEWISGSTLSTKLSILLDEKNIRNYLNHLTQSANTLSSTIERKSKSLARFKDWHDKVYSLNSLTDNIQSDFMASDSIVSEQVRESRTPNTAELPNAQITAPDMLVKSVKKINYRIALSFGILSLFIVALAVFSYRQFSQNVKLTAAYPSTPTTPNRQLSFQGRLEDAGGTPITTATNLTFKLWDDPTTGSQLYTTGVCSLTPDSDGVFSTQIGGTCGSAIASSVFTENANVYLEVTVASETLSPRQQIASVAYALNSETIQGFPISATVSAIRNTVVPMNQWGEIIVGEQSPRLTGVSGTFQISAPSLSLTTTSGSNGNITLAPDGTGQINFNGNTTTTNFFNVSNAQLTTGSLITGTAANNNTGFKLLDLLSGASPTSKFSVTDAGDVTLAGDLTITGDDLFMTTNTAGMILVADGTNFNPTTMSGDITIDGSGVTTIGADKITESMLKSVNVPTDELCLSYESTVGDFEWQTCGGGGGGGSNWRISSGAISPNNDTLDLLVGNIASSSAKAGFININSGTPTATVSAGTSGGAYLTATGNLATTANQSLVLGGSTTGNITLNENSNITGHAAVGATTLVNGGPSSWASTFSNLLTLQEEITDGSQDYSTALMGDLQINPTTAGTSYMGLVSNLETVDSSTTDIGWTGGLGSYIYHQSTAVMSEAVGADISISVEDSNSVINNITGAKITIDGAISNTTGINLSTDKSFGTTATTTTGIINDVGNGSIVSTGVDTTYGDYTSVIRALATGGTINTYGNYIQVGGDNAGAGTHTAYGIYVDMTVGPDTRYAGIFNGGNVGIGDTTPDAPLDVVGDVYISDGLSLFETAVSDGTIEATKFCTGDGETNCVTDFSTLVGGNIWTDAGSYIHPTSGEVLGNATLGGSNKLAGIYLGDTAPLVFGTDNDFNFAFDNSTSTLGSTLTAGTRLGINTTNALATLDLRSSLGTIPVASISGNTSMSALIVDQSGSGDIFTASSSGETRFVIKSNGNVGIGVSDPTNKLEIGGSSSTISNNAGDITIDSASNNISFAGDSLINILNTYVSGELGVGVADAIGTFHVHGSTTGKALTILNELGDQDILVASSSGTTRARLTNTGSLSLDGDYLNFGLTDSSTGYGFRDNGGTLQFKHNSGVWADVGSGGASWWDQTLGTLQPYNATVDLLVGGTATSSAKFGLINVNSGTPTATISAGTSGGIYIDASGKIATTAKQTLALGDSTSTGNIILQGGNVGIGIASPTEKLEVNGYIVAQRFVESSSATNYLDPGATSTSLAISGDILNTDSTASTPFTIGSSGNNNVIIDAGSGTVKIGAAGGGKLDAGTIDPPYTINGDKFATYVAGMTGVKEETTGNIMADEYLSGVGYRATLDFANSLIGSDLWLFSKASSLKNQLDKLVVLLSANNNAKTWYVIDAIGGKLHLYSTIPANISYRLTAPRYDSTAWLNTRGDDSDSIGHVINDEESWSVSEQIATLFSGSTPVISPLAEDSTSTISGKIVIRSTQDNQANQEPLLLVEGTITASTVSARLAELENIQAENISAKNIVADTITANTIIGLDAKIASLSGITDLELESITDRIKSRLASLVDPVTAEDLPIPEESTNSTIISDPEFLTPNSTESASLSSADIDFATINNYLAVIGNATITTLDVTSTLYVSSINSKTGTLALADNTLILDPAGSVAINGDLTVTGSILAESASLGNLEIGTPKDASSSALGNLLAIYNEAGDAVATIDASGSASLASLTTNMITIASSGTATDSSALSSIIGEASSNATAGIATLTTPNTELTIASPYVTANSLVYLTPTTNTDNKVLFVKSKESCTLDTDTDSCVKSFTVAIDSPAGTDISFNWWIIELAKVDTSTQLDQQL